MNDLEEMIRESRHSIEPSADFTDRVMDSINRRRAQWWYRTAFWAPTLAIFALIGFISLSPIRGAVLRRLDPHQAIVADTNDDIAEIEELLGGLDGDFKSLELDGLQ